MMSYADQVAIGGQPSKDAVPGLLYTSAVGKHTSIIFLNRCLSGGEVVVSTSHYIWEHPSQRPNTHSYPVACPLCHTIYSWQSIPADLAAAGSPILLKCKAKLEGGEKCKGSWEIAGRPESAAIKNTFVGTWRKL
jgi:hypothetical protein